MTIDPSNGYQVLLVALGCMAGTILAGYAFLRIAAWELHNAISPFVLWPERPDNAQSPAGEATDRTA